MAVFYRIKWLLFGFSVGLIISGIVLLSAKYTYVNKLFLISQVRFNNKRSMMYFDQALKLRSLETGQLVHTAQYIDKKYKHFYVGINPQNINNYQVKISSVPQSACRFIIDMSYSSNIIKYIYIDQRNIDLSQFQPISGHFLLVNGKAVSVDQDAYSRQVCANSQGHVQIRMEILAHPPND